MKWSRINWYKYKSLAIYVKLLSTLHLINKNSKIQHTKRKYLIKSVSNTKLISETAGAAHTLYHPNKTQEEVKSIKKYLNELIEECEFRKLDNSKIIIWAREIMNSNYISNDEIQENKSKWDPNINRLDELYKVLKERTSIRSVKKQNFNKELIYRLISSAIEAPSSCNKQSWRFVIVEDSKKIEEISRIKKQPFIKNFPYIIVCCFDKESYKGLDYEMTPYLDCGGAIMNLVNSATAIGLASCWCNFTIKKTGTKAHNHLRKLIKLSKNIIPVSIVCVGVPQKINKKPTREDLKFYMPYEDKKI